MTDATPNAPPGGSVTGCIEGIKHGDPAAAKRLWDGYFARLVALARARLRATPRGAADEEDVALSVFHSLLSGAQAGAFPRLDDRDDLWQVLFVLTSRKVVGLIRHEMRKKRGGGRVVPLPTGGESDSTPGGAALAATDPAPELEAEVTEQCSRLLGLLDAGGLRDVAVWKMEGYTNAEIAVKLGRSVPAVERKLAAIRTIWRREIHR